MRNQRVQCHDWLGPCDWSRDTQLPQVACCLARASLMGENVGVERVTAHVLCYMLGLR